MSRPQAELERLYLVDGAGHPAVPSPDGRVRALVLEVAGPDGWDALGKAWQGVQADLHLPAPGIAVSGVDAYQLWFSLADAVPAAEGSGFLQSLRTRYLAGVRPERIRVHPGDSAPPAIPPLELADGRWSAFIAPDLATLFADEHWLDVHPNADAQAELLSRLQPVRVEDWKRALEALAPSAAAETAMPSTTPGGEHHDPRRFLLSIMNDPAVGLHLRIEAAKALLPYTEGASRG